MTYFEMYLVPCVNFRDEACPMVKSQGAGIYRRKRNLNVFVYVVGLYQGLPCPPDPRPVDELLKQVRTATQ
jgi:hypothetical protein